MKRPDNDPSKRTKVYHITCSREYGVGCLYFWGCNLRCRLCLLKKEAFDCHLPETRFRIYDPTYRSDRPRRFLTLKKILLLLDPVELKQIILMGAEPLCDRSLPQIVTSLKRLKGSFIVLLTNGTQMPPLSLVDQVIFSIKAITPSLHRDYTGYDNEAILENFVAIASSKSVSLHTETVFIPGYVDEDEVMRIADFIASVDRSIPFRIDAYLPIQGLPWHAPSAETIRALAEKARCILPNTSCFYGNGGKTDLAYPMERIF